MVDGKLHTQELVVTVLSKFNGGILVNLDVDNKYPNEKWNKCIASENIIEFINE